MNKLLSLLYEHDLSTWSDDAKSALEKLFGAEKGRYPERAKSAVQIRAPQFADDSNIPFATLIEPSNPKSGPYGGFSVGLFPVTGHPCLLTLGTGTTGLHPDEVILSRPGHARKIQAICETINKRERRFAAWAKHDPTRNDLSVPDNVAVQLVEYAAPLKRYGKDVHAIYRPSEDREAASFALKAFFDLYFEERAIAPLSAFRTEADSIKGEYYQCLMPVVGADEVKRLLATRRFVILEGPPGTGKTRMALELRKGAYGEFGRSIQFHPNTTYENFIGGLAPVQHAASDSGFKFAPQMGDLMRAVVDAKNDLSRPYLLHIDEINRADLSKVLGEAVFLLEYGDSTPREISLPHDFGATIGNNLSLPPNLHIIGTMNSADRSIAIVDVAIRRRFAFKKLWPQYSVVKDAGNSLAEDAFCRLLTIFTEYASEDAFALMPGHSYFLAKGKSNVETAELLMVNLVPLLEEYLAQGYVTSFADQIRAHCQWAKSLDASHAS